MIWDNGYIQFMTVTDTAEFDEIGNPIEQEPTWGDYIPCGFEETTNLTATTAENSDYRQRSFSVRIKLQLPTERIRLFDKSKNLIAECAVRFCNQYVYVDQTHLVVTT